MKCRIEFFEYWHSGGQGSSNKDADSRQLKDNKTKTPVFAAKTLNGVLREKLGYIDGGQHVVTYLGEGRAGKDGKVTIDDLLLTQEHIDTIVQYGLQQELYTNLRSTKISEQGTAENKSLRATEVVVPMVVEREINLHGLDPVPIVRAMGMIKELGLKRNRGLGRCKVSLIDDNGEEITWQPNT